MAMGDAMKVDLSGKMRSHPSPRPPPAAHHNDQRRPQRDGSDRHRNDADARIHEAAMGVNDAVIVPMTKSGDNTFTIPANAS